MHSLGPDIAPPTLPEAVVLCPKTQRSTSMSRQLGLKRLQGTVSVLALSTAAMVGSSAMQSAQAQAPAGLFAGGSSLVSLAMRQIMDCYSGVSGPTGCSTANVKGLYAAVGSGNGYRGFISNDPHQFFLGTPNPTVTMPATPPPYIDTAASAPFNAYPYPNVDFGASDSPFANVAAPVSSGVFVTFTPPSGWEASPATATGTTTITYATSTFGAPIQLPLIEAPVAIAINTTGMTVNSSLSSGPGKAIQLTTAQICAIFSGEVLNWNESKLIASLDSAGAVSTTQAFSDANVGIGVAAAKYSSASLPIQIVFRSDGSGTSYIMTNYLKSVCPQLDNGTNKYATIFGASNLPSTSFTQLRNNINAQFSGRTTNWVGTDGSQNVAQAINNVATSGSGSDPVITYSGRIGYLSADFTQPYLSTSTATYAPLSASVQNEDLRANGFYLPPSTIGEPNFIAPTPAGADAAFVDLTVPATTATHYDWNIYADTWPASTTFSGVNISGLSKLGIPTAAEAYPVMGTAFAGLYSCYKANGTTQRGTVVRDFLSWYYAPDGLSPSGPRKVLESNGFGALSADLRAAALEAASKITNAGTGTCVNMSGG
jgi:phosphate transport system substrate-binding protein